LKTILFERNSTNIRFPEKLSENNEKENNDIDEKTTISVYGKVVH
jgi:hypothetical protein